MANVTDEEHVCNEDLDIDFGTWYHAGNFVLAIAFCIPRSFELSQLSFRAVLTVGKIRLRLSKALAVFNIASYFSPWIPTLLVVIVGKMRLGNHRLERSVLCRECSLLGEINLDPFPGLHPLSPEGALQETVPSLKSHKKGNNNKI